MKKYKYVLFMAVPMMFGFNACQEYEHPVIIEGMGSLGPNDYFTIFRDMKTDSTKVFYWDCKPNLYGKIQLGDTAGIICHEGFYNQEVYYQNHNIISWRDANMVVDGPTFARRNQDNPVMKQITRGKILVR